LFVCKLAEEVARKLHTNKRARRARNDIKSDIH